MGVESPPFAVQAGTYGAEQARRAIGAFLQRGASIGSVVGGIVASGDCVLSPPGSGMSVNVAPGEIFVPGSSSSTQSSYYCRVSSSSSLAISAADPSNPRIDRVSAVVTDAAYTGATNTFAVAVTTGTPSAGANLTNLTGVAAAPTSSYTLGYVLVPAGAANIVGGDLLGVATQASIGLGVSSAPAAHSSLEIAMGLVASNFPFPGNGSSTPASQTTYAHAIGLQAGEVIRNVVIFNATAVSGAAPTNVQVGISDSSGKMVAVSGNLNSNAAFSSVHFATLPLSATYTVPSTGLYYLVFLKNGAWGTTDMGLQCFMGHSDILTIDTSGASFMPNGNFVIAIAGSSNTTLPSVGANLPAFTFEPTGNHKNWIGVS